MTTATDPWLPVCHARSPCLFCGEAERVELFEVWDHEFMLETCCEGLHEILANDMTDDPTWARSLLQSLGVEVWTGHRLRRLADDGGAGLVLDLQLRIQPVGFATARAFVSRHHAHCRPPVTWRFGASVMNGATLVGVCTVGNPVARALCGKGIVEVNRLCVRRDVPQPLAWNAASMLYGWAAREAACRGWSKIVTYTRVDEVGTSLRAAGWIPEATTRGRSWHNGRRRRSNANALVDKIRWSKTLHVNKATFPRAAATDCKTALDHPKPWWMAT